MKPTGSGSLLTVEQAANRLNVSPIYVRRRLLFEKRIPYIKIGRHVRIDSRDLEMFIDQGRIAPLGLSDSRPTSVVAPLKGGRRVSWRTSGSTP